MKFNILYSVILGASFLLPATSHSQMQTAQLQTTQPNQSNAPIMNQAQYNQWVAAHPGATELPPHYTWTTPPPGYGCSTLVGANGKVISAGCSKQTGAPATPSNPSSGVAYLRCATGYQKACLPSTEGGACSCVKNSSSEGVSTEQTLEQSLRAGLKPVAPTEYVFKPVTAIGEVIRAPASEGSSTTSRVHQIETAK